MLHMIVEQTIKHPMRMIYDPDNGSFTASDCKSLLFERNFTQPYGWIKESGTPPDRHWDCILMTDNEYNLGDEVEIKVIGVFKRADFDHKYIAVEAVRDIDDYTELSIAEKSDLNKLYPHISEGEGWFGKEAADCCMNSHPKTF